MPIVLRVLILFLPVTAFAVDTTLCPNNFKLSYSNLIPVAEKKIERLRRNPNPEVYRLALKARQTIIRTTSDRIQNLDFKFNEGSGGVCFYRRSGGGAGSGEIFSRSGTDHLRVYLPLRGLDVYTVHGLQRVNERGIKPDYRPTTPIFVKIETRSYHVGWAYSLNVEP